MLKGLMTMPTNAAPVSSRQSASKKLRLRFFPLGLSQLIWLMLPSVAVGATISILGIAVDRYLSHLARPILLSDYLQGLAAALLFYAVALYYSAYQHALLAQLRMVAEMNHHVRNALAALTFSAHLSNSSELDGVNRAAVSRIEWALREVLPDPLRQPGKEPLIVSRRNISALVATLGFVIALCLLDYAISTEITLILYLIPVSLAAWYGGQSTGLAIAVVSAIGSLLANRLAGLTDSQLQMIYWNGLLKLSLFMVAAFVVAAVRAGFEMLQELSRIEDLASTIMKPVSPIDTSSATAWTKGAPLAGKEPHTGDLHWLPPEH